MSSKKSGIAFLTAVFLLTLHSYPSNSVYTDEECLKCHGKSNLSQILSNGTIRSLYVDAEDWAGDLHHMARLTCVDCHINANPYLHFREGSIDVNCEICHRIEAEEYQRNAHFDFVPLAPGRELPRCYHCHTKHRVLKLDNQESSINEKNLETTCGECHPEVMVRRLLNGASFGKISGHRKGDLSERFDMKVCITCHNPQHSTTRVARDFCVRCHDVQKKASLIIGPTHLASRKWLGFNYAGGGLALFLLIGTAVFASFRARKNILIKCREWLKSMEREEKTEEVKESLEIKAEEKEPVASEDKQE